MFYSKGTKMPRPPDLTPEKIIEYDEIIDNDPCLDPKMANNPVIMEVCRAGRWLAEKLAELKYSDSTIGMAMYYAGAACFGRDDPWEVHQIFLDQFMGSREEIN